MEPKVTAIIISGLGWGWLPSSLFQYRRRIRNSLWSRNPGAVCIDIGCGTGLTSIEKAIQWPRTSFYCIDKSKTELYKGQALSKALRLTNVLFVQADACNLPLKKGTVNTIIAGNILMDLRDIKVTFSCWSKVMKRQSTIIIETPMAPQKHILFKSKALRSFVKYEVDTEHGFIDGELENLLGLINFKPIRRLPAYTGIGVVAREIHYILTAIHPILSTIIWWPLYLMTIIGRGSDRGNAATIIAEHK